METVETEYSHLDVLEHRFFKVILGVELIYLELGLICFLPKSQSKSCLKYNLMSYAYIYDVLKIGLVIDLDKSLDHGLTGSTEVFFIILYLIFIVLIMQKYK